MFGACGRAAAGAGEDGGHRGGGAEQSPGAGRHAAVVPAGRGRLRLAGALHRGPQRHLGDAPAGPRSRRPAPPVPDLRLTSA